MRNPGTPPAPLSGEGATPVIVDWLDKLGERGPNVPHDGRHAITVYADALGILMPLKHPAVNVAQRVVRTKPKKHAPAVPLEFSIQLELFAADSKNDKNIRFYCSSLCLLIFASLRFSDTIEIQQLRTSKSAVCGVSIDQKSGSKRELINWAAPRRGFRSNGAWVNPILAYWGKFQPPKGEFYHLFPQVDKNWKISNKQAQGNCIQSVISRLEFRFGFPKLLTIQRPRNFYATCARQLLFSKEERNTLGHWKADSEMRNTYDRAVCATELRLRDSILNKIDGGWRPAPAFEIPNPQERADAQDTHSRAESSADSTSYTSTAEDIKEERINDIAQLND